MNLSFIPSKTITKICLRDCSKRRLYGLKIVIINNTKLVYELYPFNASEIITGNSDKYSCIGYLSKGWKIVKGNTGFDGEIYPGERKEAELIFENIPLKDNKLTFKINGITEVGKRNEGYDFKAEYIRHNSEIGEIDCNFKEHETCIEKYLYWELALFKQEVIKNK